MPTRPSFSATPDVVESWQLVGFVASLTNSAGNTVAAYRSDIEGFELDATLGIETLDGVDEAKHTSTDQVARIHAVRKASTDTTSNELHQRRVVHDQTVARDRVLAVEPALPTVIEV